MVKAKLFGLVRLNAGIASLQVDANQVSGVIEKIAATGKVDSKDLKQCTILVDGKQVNLKTKLRDGAEVVFLSPVGGG